MTTADFKNHKFINNNFGIDEQFMNLYAGVKKLRNGSSVLSLPFYYDSFQFVKVVQNCISDRSGFIEKLTYLSNARNTHC